MKNTEDTEDKVNQGIEGLEKVGKKSLTSWFKREFRSKLEGEKQLVSISGFVMTERGNFVSIEEILTKRLQGSFIKRCSRGINSILKALKDCVMNERALFSFSFRYEDGETEESKYFLIRFNDVEYVHEEYGNRVKEMGIISKILDDNLFGMYKFHLHLCAMTAPLVEYNQVLYLIMDDEHQTLKKEALESIKDDPRFDKEQTLKGLKIFQEIYDYLELLKTSSKSSSEEGSFKELIQEIQSLPLLGKSLHSFEIDGDEIKTAIRFDRFKPLANETMWFQYLVYLEDYSELIAMLED